MSWAPGLAEARRQAREWWPTSVLGGSLAADLATPRLFEAAVAHVSEEQVAAKIPCGSDEQFLVDVIREYERAGFDHVYVHQVGPRQEEFLEFFADRVLPALGHEKKEEAA